MAGQLEYRPTATTLDLEDLLRDAWAGRIRVPRFQRDYRWNLSDVLKLLDSIRRGYPIGSLLLWRRDAPEDEHLNLGALTIHAPKVELAYWVVDGQQRITSLANAFHPQGATDPRFGVSYDLRRQEFVGGVNHRDPWIIPLPTFFDLQSLLRWFAERPGLESLLDEATGVAKILRQYKVPAYEVAIQDETVLVDIFDRMNNFGKRLKRSEIFSALHSQADGLGGGHENTLEMIADQIDSKFNWGVVDSDTVLRAVLARRGPDVTREIRAEFDSTDRRGVIDFPSETRDDAYVRGHAAMELAVQFLRDDIGLPHFAFLPYRYLLVVLTRLFGHFPVVESRNRVLLRRWYWRAALQGPEHFKGSATGAMRALAGRIRPGDLDASLAALLDAVGVPRELPRLDRMRANEAAGRIILCEWWANRPRRPSDGEPVSSTDIANNLLGLTTASDVVSHLVPQNMLGRDLRYSAGNRILLPSDTESVVDISAFLQPPIALAYDHWTAVLVSHGLTMDLLQVFDQQGPDTFVRRREADLTKRLHRYLALKTEQDFEDTPSLDSLVMDDPE